MRKSLLTAVAAAAACISSCTPSDIEQNNQETVDDLVEMTFGATTATESTRTILGEKADGEFPILWNPLDSINVFDVNESPYQEAKLRNQTQTAADASTTFKGLVHSSETGYYALYPWQKVGGDQVAGGLIDTDSDNVPETLELEWCGYNQQATAFGYDPEKAFMMAYSAASGDEFKFKQVFSYIKFTVTFDCDYVMLAGGNDEVLGCQNIRLKMVDGSPSIVKTTLNKADTKTVTLRTKSLTADNKNYVPAGTYLMAVIPGTLSNGFTITFKPTAISNTVSKSTTKEDITLKRGNILNLGSFSTSDFTEFPSVGEWEGSGTESDPYLITTIEQWNLLAERMNGSYSSHKQYYEKYYKLNNDIDCKGKKIACVGNAWDRPFCGTFDGNRKTISNYIPSTGDGVEALFGYVSAPTITDLTVKPAGFSSNYEGADEFAYSPLIAVCTNRSDISSAKRTTVENCHVAPYGDESTILTLKCGDIDCYYGSVIAWVRGSLYCMRCDNSLNITLNSSMDTWWSTYSAGGIVGAICHYFQHDVCSFDRCRNTGRIEVVSTDDVYAGGILGYDYNHLTNNVVLRMTNCENRGRIIASKHDGYDNTKKYAGGLVGNHDSDGIFASYDPFFYNCLNTGEIVGNGTTCYCAGLTGFCDDNDTHFYSCVNIGAVTGNTTSIYIGNFCGVSNGTYNNCFYTTKYPGNPSGSTYANWMFGSGYTEESKYDCQRDDDDDDIVGGEIVADAKTTNMNSYRSAIPDDHPDASVIFASYGKETRYAYWSGKASDRSLKLDF